MKQKKTKKLKLSKTVILALNPKKNAKQTFWEKGDSLVGIFIGDGDDEFCTRK